MTKPRGMSTTVRFNDNHGADFRLNKTVLNKTRRSLFYYYVKLYEQVCRADSAIDVFKKAEMLRSVSKRFPSLTPLPVGFGLLEPREKQLTLMQLVSEQLDDAERICEQFQGVDKQADYPDDMQVDEGSGSDPASEGVANTSPPPDDASLQNVPLGSVRSEGSPGVVPPGLTLDQGWCTLSQLGNPEGRPPPSSRQCPDELNQSMSDVECRALRYPDLLPDFDSLKEQFILFQNKLKDREISEALDLVPRMTGRSKKNVGDIRPALYDGNANGDMPSKSIMEDFSPQASDLHVSGLCSGGEKFPPGLGIITKNTLQTAEPFADEQEQWAECLRRPCDMPFEEICTDPPPSPVRHVSIDTLPA